MASSNRRTTTLASSSRSLGITTPGSLTCVTYINPMATIAHAHVAPCMAPTLPKSPSYHRPRRCVLVPSSWCAIHVITDALDASDAMVATHHAVDAHAWCSRPRRRRASW
eukprot:CAMPEP_0179719880 /NCGR_PEP_ID=MMETSP0938-20121108/3657_1 /TAXON_ID=548131 ORGANISM="Ostreococcus mediterraneus, Strain clade-D-RCC1107" /NCGR_SAMPLE_ID=MMETSP0938 /ASSEMBLY_ACC=CAM_ASM_000576 /LENGTH=109 /DNA_ID=CAMNT_0021593737 /DNA_START=56 /DNA_END=382 /DNA_ORIENTATION=-